MTAVGVSQAVSRWEEAKCLTRGFQGRCGVLCSDSESDSLWCVATCKRLCGGVPSCHGTKSMCKTRCKSCNLFVGRNL